MTGSRSAKMSAATAQLLTGRSATGRPGSGRPDMGSVSHQGPLAPGPAEPFAPLPVRMVRTGWAGWRWRDGAGAGWIFRPHEQDRARGVVDDEPAGRAKALGPEPGTVAVPGQDEQAGPGGRGHDLALDAPPALDTGAGAGQPAGRRGQQVRGGGGGELGQPPPRVAFRVTAAQQ